MSSFRGISQRREIHRALGFFDTYRSTLLNLLPVLGGLLAASAVWSEGFVQAVVGFLVGAIATAIVITVRMNQRCRRRMAAWEALLAEAGLGGIDVLELEPTSQGLRLELTLPPHVVFHQIQRAVERIEVAAGLPRGGVRAERDPSVAQTVWLHATLSSGGDQAPQRLPPDPGPGLMSVNEPLPIGIYDDGGLCEVQLGHTNALIANGGADTSSERCVRVLVAQLARCNDTLIWLAVPGGARQAAPWLTSPRYALDWAAADLDETELMLNSALRLARRRSRSGPAGDRVQPSDEFPAVIVVIPDAGLVLSPGRSAQHRRITHTALELAQTGPREAVTLAVGMRTEAPVGLIELRQYCGLRIGLGLTHHLHTWRVFPDQARPDREALSGEGSMQVHQSGFSGDRIMPAWLFEVSRDEAMQVADQCERRRPILEDSAADADPSYRSRWDRWRCATGPSGY